MVIGVIAFVAIGITVEFVFLPKALSTGSKTTTPPEPVNVTFDRWVADLSSRNVTALASLYAQNATVAWTGNAAGLAGTYKGEMNITILYGATFGKDTLVNATIEDYNQTGTNPNNANVTFTLNVKANSTEVGAMTIQVNASQDWNYVGGQWKIMRENWDYVTFNEQIRGCCATTFPQWTALREGLNTDLVSDKSFEWHAGPYMAASVYAFLGGIVALGFTVYWKGNRR